MLGQTDGGEVLAGSAAGTAIIDTDVHELTRSLHDLVPYLASHWQRYITEAGWTFERGMPFVQPTVGGLFRADAKVDDGSRPGSDIDLLRRQLLDENAITYAILTSAFYPAMMHGWQEFAVALASAYNDWLIATWLDKEPRLRGSVCVAAQDPEAAAREIDRVGQHPGMVQVMLPIADRAWGEARFHPVFEAANRNGLAVAFHHTANLRAALGYMSYYIEWHSAVMQGFMCEVISLICNGVFDKFPELRVFMLEGGFTWVPSLMWRMDQQYRQLRHEIPWVKRMPSEYFRENLKFSTQPMDMLDKGQFLQIVEMMGSDRMLVFASDYPHWDFDSPSEALPRGIPDNLRRKILFENAQEVYRLKL